MNTTPLHTLDQQELQKLAADAAAAGDKAGTLVYLKAAAARADANALSHYVLGIEYAELGLFEKAIDAIEAAVAMDPALSIARFQLGLLCMSSGNGPRAIEVLEVLGELSQANYLHHFGVGLCHMARDEFAPALEALTTGIAMNGENLPLNTDMQRMVDSIVALQADQAQEQASSEDANLMFLSAYTGNTTH